MHFWEEFLRSFGIYIGIDGIHTSPGEKASMGLLMDWCMHALVVYCLFYNCSSWMSVQSVQTVSKGGVHRLLCTSTIEKYGEKST